MTDPLLNLVNGTVSFGGVRANSDVNLEVAEGEIVGLIGPNGAGKSTSLNAISGVVKLAHGQMWFRGADITSYSPYRRTRIGIRRSFQTPSFVDDLNVFQNVLIGLENSARGQQLGSAKESACWEALDRAGLRSYGYRSPATLPYGIRRLVDVTRAAVTHPAVLLFDEPAAGLDPDETADLGRLILSIVEECGAGILLVEHDVHFIMTLVNRVYVLGEGAVLASGAPDEVVRDPAVIAAYLGPSFGAGV